MCDGAEAGIGFRSCRLVRPTLVGRFRTRGCTGGLWRLGSVLGRRGGELFG